MKFIIVDKSEAVCEAARQILPEADVRNCTLREIPHADYDILFTPGNSFGFMDGGFDLAVRDQWPHIEQYVRRLIRKFAGGMLPVGCAVEAELDSNHHLIYIPTMRVPMPINGTDNIYWAMRAGVLACASYHKRFQEDGQELRVLTPGLGTLAGKVQPSDALHQMRLAIEHIRTHVLDDDAVSYNWQTAWNDHNEIRKYIGS